jgi:predicted Zn finger-like uncharacterized protein
MIIECQACHARFRLDESKIKGKGARVRCRRCSEPILVMKEDAGPQPDPLQVTPTPGQFDINLAVEESLGRGDDFVDLGAQAPPAPAFLPDEEPPPAPAFPPGDEPSPVSAILPEPEPAPAPGFGFDPGAEPASPDLFASLPPEAGPPQPPPPDDVLLFRDEATAGAPAFDAEPPVYESGVDPFAASAPGIPAAADSPLSPVFLTETPIDLSPEKAPPPLSPELDEVDLAFEQFLAGTEDAPAPAAPAELAPDLAPPADDLFDLSAPAADAVALESPLEPVEPAPFVLNDSETLDLIGTEYEAQDRADAPPAAAHPDPFAFQIDEEVLRIPDPAGASLFMQNTVQSAEPDDFGQAPAPRKPEPPAQKQPLPQELPVSKSALGPRKPVQARESAGRPGVAIFAVLFLALAGAGGYLGFTDSGRGALRSLVPAIGPLLGGSKGAKPGGPQYDIRNLIGYYDNTVKAGRMFVIKGQVTNAGVATKGRIRIHAALLDNTNKMLAEKTVYAGNVLGGEELRVADKDSIEKALSSPFGDRLVNLDIAPGKSVPFMVVFLDIPEGIDAYRLEAKEGE